MLTIDDDNNNSNYTFPVQILKSHCLDVKPKEFLASPGAF
jgi:hypothetical protein